MKLFLCHASSELDPMGLDSWGDIIEMPLMLFVRPRSTPVVSGSCFSVYLDSRKEYTSKEEKHLMVELTWKEKHMACVSTGVRTRTSTVTCQVLARAEVVPRPHRSIWAPHQLKSSSPCKKNSWGHA